MPTRAASPVPAWGHPPSATFVDVLRWRAEREADRPAFAFLPDAGGPEPRHSYASLDERARAIAAVLRDRFAPGDRAVLLYPSGLEFVEAFFGCLYAGIIAVPAYPPRNRGHLPRLRALLQDCGARIALTHSKTIDPIRQQTGGQPEWAGIDLLATDTIPASAAAGPEPDRPAPGSLAFLQYTSGSTGTPKGVMVTHRNLVYGAHYITVQSDFGSDGVSVCWLPSFHDMGLIDGVLMPLYAGGLAVLLSPVAFVQRPACWLQAITRFRGTHGGSPNFGYDLCVQKIPPEVRASLDLSSWACAYNGSEPLRAATLRAFSEAFAPCGLQPRALYPTYGLAEATLMVTGCELDRRPVVRRAERAAMGQGRFIPASAGAGDEEASDLVSSGKAILETKIAVVDAVAGRRAAPGAIGEIWIAGPTVCAGYWQRAAETEETFRARLPGEPDAWLRTGDLGYQDDEGELFICGRAKDLIIIRGRNYYPQDIEDTAGRADPALRAGGAAAFSFDAGGEERLVVVQEVERTALRTLDPAVAGAAVARALAEEHGVGAYAIVLLKPGSAPKTSSGKIRRAAAREQFLAGSLAVVGEWRAAAAERPGKDSAPAVSAGAPQIAAWLTARLAARLQRVPSEVDPRTSFSAYGLDSAAHIELSGELQAWLEHPVPPMELYDYPDIARLSAHLAGGAPEGEKPAGTPPGPAGDTAVAILGLGLRLPGGAADPASFWRLLRDGVDAISEMPAGRWEAPASARASSAHGGFLDDIDRFDAEFFGISPREAASLDPQQRLLLETAWHALEDAGLDGARLAGSDTGVFVGISTQDYARRTLPSGAHDRIDAYSGTGSALSAAAGRLAYFFDFHGPAVAIDTACSSSLVAVHQACRALLGGECALALAGGVNAILGPELAINFAHARMLAPDGRCKAFDAAADGYVRSEGCGLVVLKRLGDALAAGDPILAVIRGSAVGQDGRSNGLTAPNGPAQERVIRSALASAGVAPAAIGYVEAHGTGTALGDPIEAQALGAALGSGRPADAPLWVGSVKTNLGHLEAAAGIASLAKVVLALRHGEIPASLHFRNPSPHIPWERLALRVASRRVPWPSPPDGSPRRAGVSSFGFTGTNAHLIVEEANFLPRAAPEENSPRLRPVGGEAGPSPPPKHPANPYLLPISARTPEAARRLAHEWADWLEAHPAVPLADVCATAAEGRAALPYRLVAEGVTTAELSASARTRAPSAAAATEVGVAFLFTGQGSQQTGMGRELLAREPVFRAALERCAAVLDPLLPRPLLDVMHDRPDGAALDETRFAQPALFALEWSLAELLASWGIRPAAALGHSVGEFAAACAAGVFSVEDGLRLVAARGKLMQALPAGGGMLAAMTDEAAVRPAIKGCPGVVIAAVNGPAETVLSGPLAELAAAAAALAARGVKTLPLAVSHAFHSPLMEPMLADFDRVLATVRFSPPRFPVISALSGAADLASPAHWRAHTVGAVRFADAVRTLERGGWKIFLELGPRPVLSALAQKSWRGAPARWVPTLRPGRGEAAQLGSAAAELWTGGVPVEWAGLRAPGARRRSGLGMPRYPFARERHWMDLPAVTVGPAPARANPTLRGWTAPASPRAMAFGIMFFNGLGGAGETDPYRFLLEAARFADGRGFSSVWVPERHYTRFGGLYPNPSVIAAMLARQTRSLRLMAGSLVAPLHPPLRIAEDWAVIDNLSGGRAGISFASGWNPDDFAMNPGAYADRHEAVFRTAEEVRRLWRGEMVDATSGTGRPGRVRVYPAPVQRELPLWVTAAGNPKTFERAGEIGANLLTHLLDQEPARLAEKIALYRAARDRAGHDPDAGRVTAMIHTFLGPDDASVRACIREPYCAFLKENIHLLQGLAASRGAAAAAAKMSPADLDDFVGFLFERFYSQRALFGTPEAAAALVEKLGEAGVNEIACLLDFGAPVDDALAALPSLDVLRRRFAGESEVERVDPTIVISEAARNPVAAAGEIPRFARNDTRGTTGSAAPAPPVPGEGIFHRLEWREVPAEPAGSERLAGIWLVLGEGGFAAGVAEALAARGASPVMVGRGQSFAETGPGRFRIDPLAPADFAALLARLPEPPRGAVHLWSLDIAGPGPVTTEGVRDGVQAGVAGLLHLAQAFDQAGAPGRIWLVTRSAVGEVAGSPTPCALAQAPAWGLGRVLALEHSEIWGGAVDLDFGAAEDEPVRLVEELARPDAEDQLALRGGRRFVPRLVSAAPEAFSPLAPRPDATYLITGGLGGLGRRVARWLVERGARHLVLTGLHPLPPRSAWPALPAATDDLTRQKIDSIRFLESLGARVQTAAADATDAGRMAELFREIARQGPPLAGVFHLAGLPENRPVRDTVFAEHGAVLGPKTTGAWILHELTRDLKLDWWVAFSSISAVWGSRGQPLYAAANAFLDALGQHRRSQGLPATIVNWGPWAEGGMVVSAADLAQLARMGLRTTAPADGIAALELLLVAGRPHEIVATVDWTLFKELFATRGRSSLFAELGAPPEAARLEPTPFLRELAVLGAPERRERLTRWIQEGVAATLRWSGGRLPDPARGFFEMGMDSLMAIEVKNRLQAELGVALRATVVFNHPNIAALASFLTDRVGSAVEAAAAAPAPAAPGPAREPVAIVGIGCRFPGGVRGPESFWEKLLAGFDAVREVPPERWPVDAYYDADPDAPGKVATRQGAFLDEVDRFDARFFGISPREAESMDPQQRVLLETTWEALEHAGIPPADLSGSATGVFVGLTVIDYLKLVCGDDLRRIDAYAATGNVANIAAGRISYFFGLRGPAVALDTACSSSLVAVHLACQSLRAGESSMALAAGVNLMLAPDNSVAVSRARMLSPGGSCRAFDAAADGYVRGEGCGVVVLKLLSRAQADGDRVLAVIRGSAVGQDGARSGLTVPNGPAQAALIRQVLADSGTAPSEVGYLEAHGTGTPLGDPIEAEALAAVFGGDPKRRSPLVLASLKTNLGHMESAAGIGGLIKAALAVRHGRIPPHLHFRRENPELRLADIPARIPTQVQSWPVGGARRLAGVSSFGSSGTIAHVLVEEGPAAAAAGAGGGPPWWLLLSAKSRAALHRLAGRAAAWLEALPAGEPVADLCWTAAAGRTHFSHRLAVCGGSAAELAAALAAPAAPPPDSPGARYLAGAAPDLAALFGGWRGRRATLPSYPFARDRHWVDGARGEPAGPGSAPAPGAAAAPDCLWEIAWRPVSFPSHPTAAAPPGRWAVIGGGPFGAALAGLLRAGGQEAEHGSSPGKYSRKADHVLNLQALDSPASLRDALTLVQHGRGRLWTVTQGAQAAEGVVPDRDAAALWGLLRALPVEQPARWGGLIDLDPAEPVERQAEALWQALHASPSEDQLARRGGRWLAARLAPRPAADLSSSERFDPAPAGPWLVTGGLGGLGWTVAEWLVAGGVREILLLGRSGADASHRKTIDDWTRRGVRALAVAADCADAASLDRALAAWRSGGGGPFGGVFHLAGAWQDVPLAELDSAGMEAVWHPKVDGARALERALASDPVGHWVYFSAFSALLPALGQANYAAANAWLDAQARRQRAAGARALALDWGPWSGTGFALTPYGQRAHERLGALGIGRLNPAEGLAVLACALASGEPQIAAMPVDWPRFFAADPQARLAPILAELAARHAGTAEADPDQGRIAKALAACPPEEHASRLVEELRRLVGGVLRLSAGEIPTDVPFTELGVDSLMAIEIKNRLQRQAGVDVPITDLLRGPTAAGLAATLLPGAKAAALAHAARASGPVEEIEI